MAHLLELTRSQHPDLRLFTQIPGKLAWVSNKSYKTWRGCHDHLSKITRKADRRRQVQYSIHLCKDNEYRILAKYVEGVVV